MQDQQHFDGQKQARIFSFDNSGFENNGVIKGHRFYWKYGDLAIYFISFPMEWKKIWRFFIITSVAARLQEAKDSFIKASGDHLMVLDCSKVDGIEVDHTIGVNIQSW